MDNLHDVRAHIAQELHDRGECRPDCPCCEGDADLEDYGDAVFLVFAFMCFLFVAVLLGYLLGAALL